MAVSGTFFTSKQIPRFKVFPSFLLLMIPCFPNAVNLVHGHFLCTAKVCHNEQRSFTQSPWLYVTNPIWTSLRKIKSWLAGVTRRDDVADHGIKERSQELKNQDTASLGFSLCLSLISSCFCFHSVLLSQASHLSYPNVKNFASFPWGHSKRRIHLALLGHGSTAGLIICPEEWAGLTLVALLLHGSSSS